MRQTITFQEPLESLTDKTFTAITTGQYQSTDHVLQIIAEYEPSKSLTDKTFPAITTGQHQSADIVVQIIAEYGQAITFQEPLESLTDKTFPVITTGQYLSADHVLQTIAECCRISKCLRKILGIRWDDFISNDNIRLQTKQQPVSSIICKRRLSWLGHAVRLPPVRLANQVLQWFPEGRRRRGRPKMNWRQTVERDLQAVSMSWKEALRLAADRGSRATLTASCVTGHGSP
ncbi:hypothetical protein Bbelb_132540 [Branchiostoma belcheri]|nr:hypothetical protein Bbelb_132540 [Branchiostoma belcheri]